MFLNDPSDEEWDLMDPEEEDDEEGQPGPVTEARRRAEGQVKRNEVTLTRAEAGYTKPFPPTLWCNPIILGVKVA